MRIILVSIHHMCRFKMAGTQCAATSKGFNTSYVSVQDTRRARQLLSLKCFNTSYVSVQDLKKNQTNLQKTCFNTSYVSVQVWISKNNLSSILRFNTSYVSVQDSTDSTSRGKSNVSIHHMCRFKCFSVFKFILSKRAFQYIICVGSSNLCYSQIDYSSLFQYIICVGSRESNSTSLSALSSFQYIICVGSSILYHSYYIHY